ncbi:MAG: P-II family nitrogen regulator [Tissierella sp.]|uniref:P-II family nitrogen regulator n=1 Tax=Tissierella sp. TaxID=41274 RepID=UPI003F969995
MNVVFIVLNETDYLDDILDSFVEIGVKGATIVDSQGMGSAMTNSGRGKDPFFGGIRTFIENARPYNKTIFTVIDDKDLLDKTVETVKEILGNINDPGVGMVFTMPVGNVYGI